MDTSFVAIVAALLGGGAGVFAASVRAGGEILDLRQKVTFWQAEASRWRLHFNRGVSDLAAVCIQRDELKREHRDAELRSDALIKECDQLRDDADVGRRRKASWAKDAADDRAERRAPAAEIREMLGAMGPCYGDDIASAFKVSLRRAGFLLREAGATAKRVRVDGRRRVLWSLPIAAADEKIAA